MFALLQTQAVPGGYGWALLQSLFALAGVCLLAWVVLKWMAGRGVGTLFGGKNIRVVERAPLDHRRALYLVRVGKRNLVVGVGDGASPSMLMELNDSELEKPLEDEVRTGPEKSFLETLRAKSKTESET